jgi:hypothetical protein
MRLLSAPGSVALACEGEGVGVGAVSASSQAEFSDALDGRREGRCLAIAMALDGGGGMEREARPTPASPLPVSASAGRAFLLEALLAERASDSGERVLSELTVRESWVSCSIWLLRGGAISLRCFFRRRLKR